MTMLQHCQASFSVFTASGVSLAAEASPLADCVSISRRATP
jgi:hypothetical protein